MYAPLILAMKEMESGIPCMYVDIQDLVSEHMC